MYICINIYALLYTYSISTRRSLHADPFTPPRCTPVDPGDHEALEMDGSQVVINMLHYRYARSTCATPHRYKYFSIYTFMGFL